MREAEESGRAQGQWNAFDRNITLRRKQLVAKWIEWYGGKRTGRSEEDRTDGVGAGLRE